jgi:hypothetical protein
MRHPSLPFTMPPIPGESFDSWLVAYAARLQAGTGELAAAIGLPLGYLNTQTRVLLTGVLPTTVLDRIAEATGVATDVLAGMFHAPVPTPATPLKPAARAIRNSWTPTAGTKFCPNCLAGNGGRLQLAWRLPWSFLCLDHNRLLVNACPRCGQPPYVGSIKYSFKRNLNPGHCRTTLPRQPDRPARMCRALLETATTSAPTRLHKARAAQRFINEQLDLLTIGEVGSGPYQAAVDALTDLTIIALHVATPGPFDGQHRIRPHMLNAGTLTSVVDLLTNTGVDAATDPLAALVESHLSPRASAVPESWRPASPTLRARVAHRRDATLPTLDRIRFATTLVTPTPASVSPDDPAIGRAGRVPDQLWLEWGLRLIDDHPGDPMHHRQAAAVALLLPHSSLPLEHAAQLLSRGHKGDAIENQLTLLAKTSRGGTALRILTELALALDQHHVPIDYRRRRRLAATTPLLDAATWKRITRRSYHYAGQTRRFAFARSYLYELLTGGSLAIAPAPYTLRALTAVRYHEFVLNLTDALVEALAEHACGLLIDAGITDEPLQWQPPTEWVTITSWPGTDPTRTDPVPLQHAIQQGKPAGQIARAHGITIEHLRQVIRRHPLPGRSQPQTVRAGTILPTAANAPRQPDVHYVDLGWLREQYLVNQRRFADIAAEIGCERTTLNQFAKRHGIPTRPRGGGPDYIALSTAAGSPADLPHPLRAALTGQGARVRIERFLVIANHGQLTTAATQIGITLSSLSKQLIGLERRCGARLFHRQHATRLGSLTPLGEQLKEQARRHLNHQEGRSP